MWSKSALLLMVRIKLRNRRGFSLPVPVWVVDEFMEALTDLAWLGELTIKHLPTPRDEKTRSHLRWVKEISPKGIIMASHGLIKDLSRHKGLDFVDVETGDVQVKITLK